MRIRKDIYPKSIRDAFVTGFVFVIIPIVYYFEIFIVLPRYHRFGSPAYYFHLVTGTVILFNVCANLVAVMMCETSIKGLVLPTDMKADWKFCTVCETITPPRSWHCNVCNVCILKRDHHCMFTSCCIGLENHRYFIIFLMYTLAASLYSCYYNLTFVAEYITFDWSWKSLLKILFPLFTLVIEWTESQFYIFVITIVLLGALFTGALLIFHLDLMFRSVVTHEKSVTKYDRGKLENIRLTLGERWYLVWLSPWIESKLPCDGINWDKVLSEKENVAWICDTVCQVDIYNNNRENRNYKNL